MAHANSPSPIVIASRERLRPGAPGVTEVRLTRLAPDGKHLAWVGDDGIEVAIFVAAIGGEPVRLVRLRNGEVDELGWSPSGDRLAYVVGSALPTGVERNVGWAALGEGELGRVDGAAFGWSSTGRALLVADLRRQSLVNVEIATKKELILCSLADDGDLDFPPVVTVAPNGDRAAFTSRRRAHDIGDVWVLGRRSEGLTAELITQIPGAHARVFPFWSPKGRTLGMHVVHFDLGRSAVILMRHLQGDGEVFHHHELCNAPVAPAWSPSGRHLALWVATGMGRFGALGPQTLTLIDTRTRATHVLGELPYGTPRFIDDRCLAIDGGAIVEVLMLSV
jgi:hypothetical protein